MKPTPINYIKLWWHCLIRIFEVPVHRVAKLDTYGLIRIGCCECDIIIKQQSQELKDYIDSCRR